MRLPRISLVGLIPPALARRLADLAARLPLPGKGEPLSAFKRRMVKAVCYTVFGLIAFTVFFGLGYLDNNLERLVGEGLARQNAVVVEWSGLRTVPGLPPRLEATRCVVKDKATGQLLADLGDVALWPALRGLLAGRLGVGFRASVFNGLVDGTVGTASFGLQTLRLAVDAGSVDLDKIPQVKRFDAKAGGLLTMKLVASAPVRSDKGLDLAAAKGSLWATVAGGRMNNLIPLFKVPVLELSRAVVDLSFKGPLVDLGTLQMDTNVVKGGLDGRLRVDWANLGRTKVELRGQVSPDPKLTVLEVLEPRAAEAIRAGRPISIEITDTLATAMIKMR